MNKNLSLLGCVLGCPLTCDERYCSVGFLEDQSYRAEVTPLGISPLKILQKSK